jgi:hypothetical protein
MEYYRLTITEKHILTGDAFYPHRHPIALAATELFPDYDSEVGYIPYYGWTIQVGLSVAKLARSLSDLCDDLERIDVFPDWWRIGGVSEETWRVWVWECWEDQPRTQTLPHIDDWDVECPVCRNIVEVEDMDTAMCRYCTSIRKVIDDKKIQGQNE